jgi:hypothetical protein
MPEEVMPLIRLLAGKPAYPAGPLGSLPELLPVQPIVPGAARDEGTADASMGSPSESAPQRIREIDEQIGAVKRALAGTREPQPGDGPHLPWWRAWHRLRNELAALEEERSRIEWGQTAERPRAGPELYGGVRDETASTSDLITLHNAAQELRLDIEAKRRRIHAAAVGDRMYWRENFSRDLFDNYGRLLMEQRPMVWEPVAFAYLWFDELNEQVPFGTPVPEDKVEPLKQGIGQLEHASDTLRDLVVELSQETASPGPARDSPAPAAEFVSIEHRNQIRELLNRCSAIMGTGQPVNWGGDPGVALRRRIVESHYPELAQRVEAWNVVAARRQDASNPLRVRFERELEALSLEERFNVPAIVNSFSELTEQRALGGTLGVALTREQVWDLFGPVASGPPVGAQVKGARDIAISMEGIPDEEYKETGIEFIDTVHAVLAAAQDWPEAEEIVAARDAVEAFDRQSILHDIERMVARENIRAVEGCPVCGEVD